MTYDYTKIAATASRLVTKYGRSITLVELNKTPPDVNKPWRGAGDVRAVPAATANLVGAFVPLSSLTRLGIDFQITDSTKRINQAVIIASTSDLSAYNEIIDDSKRWRIEAMEQLKPASTNILWFFGVRQ